MELKEHTEKKIFQIFLRIKRGDTNEHIDNGNTSIKFRRYKTKKENKV